MKSIKYKGEKQRLDIYVSGLLDITRSQAQKRIKSGEIKVGGEQVNPSKMVAQGDVIKISEKISIQEKKEAPDVNIVYEDENIIVVDKDAGVVVYPADGHDSGTLIDALRDKIGIQDEERPGVVHRLDKDTSGLMVFAKNQKSLEHLQDQIRDRKFEKTYLTLVWGKVLPEKGTIDIPIQRSEKDRKKMEASSTGRESLTEYEVVKYYDGMTFLRVKIITGRTHQIRVHFAGIGYPVVGDKAYGSRSSVIPAQAGISRQFLHAHELGFELFGKKYHFTSELPKDLEKLLKLKENQ
ncbi:MAG: RluA family pseudouridine synthase [bacterium]|nr:RluA family pseudouridine synthase [bacterium]